MKNSRTQYLFKQINIVVDNIKDKFTLNSDKGLYYLNFQVLDHFEDFSLYKDEENLVEEFVLKILQEQGFFLKHIKNKIYEITQ